MIQPNGTFQTVTLSAAAEFFGATGDLHVADLADQCVTSIENVTPETIDEEMKSLTKI